MLQDKSKHSSATVLPKEEDIGIREHIFVNVLVGNLMSQSNS